ncbi:Solute carrier family 40 protein (Fragment) [Madurella fahalii]|uniref:Solute carrier family 40 protein n=1 Tax=Madurella fahalii TaxID=1157608 RepID=A0ABQ0G9U9_9PEZI
MAPTLFHGLVVPRAATNGTMNDDILSVLMLIGPDIIQKAVAQLAGHVITPVAFSFGWVAYAVSALLRTFGDGRLMPDADMANTNVIGADSGHSRATTSWVLGRLLRDADDRVDHEMRDEQNHVPPVFAGEIKSPSSSESAEKVAGSPSSRPKWEALRVTVYDVDDEPPVPHGVPTRDWVWYSGLVVIFIQLIISIIPWIVTGDWGTFLVTAGGNALALIGGSLPQWRSEKWACPRKGGATVTITQGNGSRHAIVILGKRKQGVGLDLEILARGTRTAVPSLFTRIASALLALLWIVLLVTVAGFEENSWYLLCIGLLGSIQNLYAAGAARQLGALGIHLKHRETIRGIDGKKVAGVLKELEEKYPMVGTSLVPVFFPGSLRVKGDDLQFWQKAMDKRVGTNDYGTRVDGAQTTIVVEP